MLNSAFREGGGGSKILKSVSFSLIVSEYCEMLSPASPRLQSVWWSVSASLCVSLLIFRLQQDLGGRGKPVPLQHPEGSAQIPHRGW